MVAPKSPLPAGPPRRCVTVPESDEPGGYGLRDSRTLGDMYQTYVSP